MAATIATGLLASQLLLLLCTASTASVALPGSPAVGDGAEPPATVAGGGGGLMPELPFPFPGAGGQPHLPFPFPRGNPAAVADCLSAVHDAERCVADVLWSLASPSAGDDAGGKACCGALRAVGDRCLRGVLHAPPFRALFATLVRHACGGGGDGGLPGPGPRA